MRNKSVSALEDKGKPPKYIILVLDDDILNLFKDLHEPEEVISKCINKMLNWLMAKYEKILDMIRKYLLEKAKKDGYPYFIWIEAPVHNNINNNELHEIFNTALNSTCKLHNNITSLALKKIWDPQNKSLYLLRECRYTNDGLHFYWEAVDKTVEYADTIHMKKVTAKLQKTKKQEAQPQFKQVESSPKRGPHFSHNYSRPGSRKKSSSYRDTHQKRKHEYSDYEYNGRRDSHRHHHRSRH